MDSFYGGKRGFSFILRPNPNDENGYWQTTLDIANAAESKILKQGEYAIVTETGAVYSSNHGKIYRVTRDSRIELVGKIGNPAPLYGLEITNDLEGTEDMLFYFLNDEDSKEAEGFRVYWKLNGEDPDHPDSIGIGFEFPHPVFEVENTPANYFQLIQNQISAQEPAGISINSNDENPVYYHVKNVVPSATYIGSEEQRESVGTTNLNLGDLWMETRGRWDLYYIKRTQTTEDMKKIYQSENNFEEDEYDDSMTISFGPLNSVPPQQWPYVTYDLREMWDALTIDFTTLTTSATIPKLKPAIDSVNAEMSKSLLLNFIFSTEEQEEFNPFTDYDLYAETANGDSIVLQGTIGKKIDLINFIYTATDEPISAEDLTGNNAEITLKTLKLYGKYDSTESLGQVYHTKFVSIISPFYGFAIDGTTNITENIVPMLKSFGITWYPQEVV